MKVMFDGNIFTEERKGGKFKTIISISSYSKITEIELKDNLTKMPDCGFKNFKNLKKIIIPKTIKEIPPKTFIHCNRLEEVTMHDEINFIGELAFANCYNLKAVKLPKNITKINNGTFHECTSLTDMIIPENILEIGDEAFFDCTNLKKVVLPNNLYNIKFAAFFACYDLSEINIPDSIEIIEDKAFDKCKKLNQEQIEKIKQIQIKSLKDEELNDFIHYYHINTSDSEIIQELMSKNPLFFQFADDINRKVFLEAALDSIITIKHKNDSCEIQTELCNIYIEKEGKGNIYISNNDSCVYIRDTNNKIEIMAALNKYMCHEIEKELDR